jgi:D-glycero-D-manno-heptose 1,7-bisphosphate phosphatase
VFLDRDGTINLDSHYPAGRDALELLPNSLAGLQILSALPLDLIVVTNQAGISLGLLTREQMSEFNAALRLLVEASGARIDAFYFCPHLEPKNLRPGASPCECSKPAPGLLREAEKDFDLNLRASYVIGDKSSDIAAGQAVGCTSILVETGKSGHEEGALPVVPDRTVPDLLAAALAIQSAFR